MMRLERNRSRSNRCATSARSAIFTLYLNAPIHAKGNFYALMARHPSLVIIFHGALIRTCTVCTARLAAADVVHMGSWTCVQYSTDLPFKQCMYVTILNLALANNTVSTYRLSMMICIILYYYEPPGLIAAYASTCNIQA